nr:aspartate/glutamate/uridylate kinase [Tanacetum cinerariifolium]
KAQQELEANIAMIELWDDVQAKIDIDYELAQRLQADEQDELTDAEKAKLFMKFLEKKRKFFAAKRTKEKRNIPPTRAQQRTIICTPMLFTQLYVDDFTCFNLRVKVPDSYKEFLLIPMTVRRNSRFAQSVVAMLVAREISLTRHNGVVVAIIVGGRNMFYGDTWEEATNLDTRTPKKINSDYGKVQIALLSMIK